MIQIRKQGGAAIMTIPAEVLKKLNLHIGDALELDITKSGFLVKLAKLKKRKRYTLKELLKGATPRNIKALNKSTKWAREGSKKGRELT